MVETASRKLLPYIEIVREKEFVVPSDDDIKARKAALDRSVEFANESFLTHKTKIQFQLRFRSAVECCSSLPRDLVAQRMSDSIVEHLYGEFRNDLMSLFTYLDALRSLRLVHDTFNQRSMIENEKTAENSIERCISAVDRLLKRLTTGIVFNESELANIRNTNNPNA